MKRTENDSDMRTQILRRRYLRKDADGNVVETQEQMFRRVADRVVISGLQKPESKGISHLKSESFKNVD